MPYAGRFSCLHVFVEGRNMTKSEAEALKVAHELIGYADALRILRRTRGSVPWRQLWAPILRCVRGRLLPYAQ